MKNGNIDPRSGWGVEDHVDADVFRRLKAAGAVGVLLALAGIARATPTTLTGNYLEVGVSDYGTFGSDSRAEPGILVDPTGKGDFYPGGIPNDLLTPGTPHDGFAVISDQTGYLVNDNDETSSDFGVGSPINTSVGPVQSATWSGSTAGGLVILNTYAFGVHDEKIAITTTLTNTTSAAITNLYFGRSEDPDPDLYLYNSYNSINTRGDATYAPNELVSAAGARSGFTIGILNTTALYPVNTSISYNCCYNSDPSRVFDGTDAADYNATYPRSDNGDYGLQMAWSLGTLAVGDSATITYDYVFGSNQATVGTGGVTEPSTWALLLIGVGGVGAALRRRSRLAGSGSYSAANASGAPAV
jgi:hypothetical protein